MSIGKSGVLPAGFRSCHITDVAFRPSREPSMRPENYSLRVVRKMVRAAILVSIFLLPSLLRAQDTLVGHWEGTVTLPTRTIPIQVDFDHLHSGWQCTILLPETSAPVYTAKSVSVESARVRINLDMGLSSASLDGQLSGDIIEGAYTQDSTKGTFKVKRAANASPTGPEASRRPNSAPQPGRDESPTAGPARTPGGGGGEGSRTSGPQVRSVAATSRVIRSDDGDSRGVVPTATADSGDSADGLPHFYAVMFATDNYDSKEWPHLNNPVLDAKNIAQELEAYYGFQTKVYENQTFTGIRQTFVDDLQHEKSWKFKPNDELLIFFSGHGDFDPGNDLGYVITKDAAPPPTVDSDVRDRQIDFGLLRNWINKINVDHVVLVLDICQGGTLFLEKLKGNEQSLAIADKAIALQRLKGLKTRKCMTSGGNGAVKDGPPGQGSPFARAFMDALADAGPNKSEMVVSIQEIDTKVEKKMGQMEGASIPQYGSCGGESANSQFYFFWKDPHQPHQ